LAAGELAELKDEPSIPLIEKAMKAEQDPQVKFNMATSLLSLNSRAGVGALSAICADTSLRQDLRLDAASKLAERGDYSCLSATAAILRTATVPAMKIYALEIIARVKALPASVAPEIHQALLKSLRDQYPPVRRAAARCIAGIKDKPAAPDLRAAISMETDEPTRTHMQESLSVLESAP
jgi:HEAT repeat protein